MKKFLFFLLSISMICAEAQNDFPKADPALIALYPQQNEYRNTLNISGIWKFKKDSLGIGENQQWYQGLTNSKSIAVPGSWNEQLEELRDYMGVVWYEQDTYVPQGWKGQKIFIRVGSANYGAKIWVNGKPIGMHEGGHLPFAFDISSALVWNAANRIIIQVENILKATRVPTGGDGVPGLMGGLISNYPKTNFDFFPYGGLNRAVWLYSLPQSSSLADVKVTTGIEGDKGIVQVNVLKSGSAGSAHIFIRGEGKTFESDISFAGNTGTASIQIPQAHLWSPDDPHLYQLSVTLLNGKTAADTYELSFGVRTIAFNNKQLLLNGKPVFLKGFGKHEDFPIFGRGTAQPVMVKDFSLLKWVGANSFRTSHYPYDEEYMNMADREGFLIIDEIPAVGLFFEGGIDGINTRKEVCKQYIHELINRDKNHPSVIIWSLANEPMPPKMDISNVAGNKADDVSTAFFTDLHQTAKSLDPTRPTTIVGVMGGPVGWLAIPDIACINRYWGWYTHTGNIAAGAALLSKELDGLHATLQKPIIITEFGADAQAGLHATPSEMFTEEYQTEFIKAYLDIAATKDFVTGMHVWAFADFKTTQGVIRFGGINYKGVFTRERQPKMAAHYLRSRWYTGAK